jgi:hypothetical protein
MRSSFRGKGPLSASGWSGTVPILGHQVRDENPGAEREDDDDGAAAMISTSSVIVAGCNPGWRKMLLASI